MGVTRLDKHRVVFRLLQNFENNGYSCLLHPGLFWLSWFSVLFWNGSKYTYIRNQHRCNTIYTIIRENELYNKERFVSFTLLKFEYRDREKRLSFYSSLPLSLTKSAGLETPHRVSNTGPSKHLILRATSLFTRILRLSLRLSLNTNSPLWETIWRVKGMLPLMDRLWIRAPLLLPPDSIIFPWRADLALDSDEKNSWIFYFVRHYGVK